MHMNHMHSADMNDATQTATDPVCGMTVAVNNDAITREADTSWPVLSVQVHFLAAVREPDWSQFVVRQRK